MTPIVVIAMLVAQAQPTSVASSAGTLKIERLVTLEFPWGMCYLPDGRLLITEKPGRLRVWSGNQLSEPVSGVPTVRFHDQGGLLDVECDPKFSENHLVYLYFVEPATNQSGTRDPWDPRIGPRPENVDNTLKGGAVARGTLVGDQLQNVRVIWRQSPKTIGRGHFGGRLVFDRAGHLFVTSGDRQRFTPAQDMDSNLGKVVRINPDGSIPRDNPWPGKDVWSLGHRNPLGAAIDPATNKLWVHEMGPLGGDEINAIAARRNFGWPIVSNGDNYDRTRIPDHDTQPKFSRPNLTWNPVISPSGMVFYDGAMFNEWRGHALMGGLSSMALIRVSIDGGVVKEEERIVLRRRIRDVLQARDGSLLLLVDDKQGDLLRVSLDDSGR
jgi:glucose/arabinose dehydrogenase